VDLEATNSYPDNEIEEDVDALNQKLFITDINQKQEDEPIPQPDKPNGILTNPLGSTLYEDKCLGSIIGLTCGDILGSATESMLPEMITHFYGRVQNFVTNERGFGLYTDDTQMTIALIESLIEVGKIDVRNAAYKYADHYEPQRGYGQGAHIVLRKIDKERGDSYKTSARTVFANGSYGNGGSMRIAPIGLAYRHAPTESLYKAVVDAVVCTHVHPDGIDAAFVQAKAVALLCLIQDSNQFQATPFLTELKSIAKSNTMQTKLQIIIDSMNEMSDDARDKIIISKIGNGVLGSESTSLALYTFCKYYKSPEDSIIRIIGFGGDTDTAAAQLGALLGSLYGTSWIPQRWFYNIENKKFGREHIINITRKLALLDITKYDGEGEGLNLISIVSGKEEKEKQDQDQENKIRNILGKVKLKMGTSTKNIVPN